MIPPVRDVTGESEKNMKIKNFEQEIQSAYMFLGEQAKMQNDSNINKWFKNGKIYENERDSLKRYNEHLYKRMTE